MQIFRPNKPNRAEAGTTGGAGTAIEHEILADQVRLLYTRLLPGLLATMLNALLSGAALWGHVPAPWLTTWLAAAVAITVSRFVLLQSYLIQRPAISDARRWGRRYVVFAFLSGSIWGALGSVLYPIHSYVHQTFVAFVIAGMIGGAVSSMSFYLPAYRAFLISAMLPYILRLLANQDTVSYLMSVFSLAYVLYMIVMSNGHYQMVTGSLRLRYDNHSLRNDLQITKTKEAILNEELEGEISERKRTEAALQSSADHYRTLVETTGLAYHVLDASGRVLDANATYIALTGHRTLADIKGHHISEWTASRDVRRTNTELDRCLSFGAVRNLEVDYARIDGSTVPIEMNATVVRDEQGTRVLALSRDITERKNVENALRRAHALLEQKVQERTAALAQEKERFRVTLASIGDAVITTNANAEITYLNRVAEHLTGWPATQAKGLNLSKVFRSMDDRDTDQTIDMITRCISKGETIGPGHHLYLVRKNGKVLSIDMAVAPILENENTISGAALTFRDVTEQRELAKQLTHQATHDRLTGLVNRYEFEQRLAHALSSAHPAHPHALLYLDLDQFKVVNDTCGHSAGDDLLQQIAVILQSKLRGRDTLARLGGDEFGVILEHCPAAEALRVATALRDHVHAFRFGWSGKSFSLGVSIGLVSITSDRDSLGGIMSAADSACFAAKEKGRNRVHVYQQDDAAMAQRTGEMRWLPRIQNAIKENRLCLYCQPVMPTAAASTAPRYGEILVRMVDEHGELVPPGAFLPAAERYDQMLAIDRWVVKQSLAMIQGGHKSGSKDRGDCVYAINLSGQSIGEERFLDFVAAEIAASGFNPNLLCFEITETAAVSELSHALRFIEGLKSQGCRFALDDFGAGLSSFSYLKTLPVNYLKIDGRFVRDMTASRTDQAMVEAIHRIGHVMGLETIAEWVECEETLQLLQATGVDYAQGYHVGKPIPLQSSHAPYLQTV